jgi:hypothetical protein
MTFNETKMLLVSALVCIMAKLLMPHNLVPSTIQPVTSGGLRYMLCEV